MKDFTSLVDLAAERLGGRVLAANDEFFAPKENLLKASPPIFIDGKYTTRGKWMDGWETRRRRTPGHDWCIIRLGLPGMIRGVVVDTSFFKGNYPERCSVEACAYPAGSRKDETKGLLSEKAEWTELLHEVPLAGDSQNQFVVESLQRFTHVRLRIFPDGGVARFRVHGEVVPALTGSSRKEIDLVAIENGGRVVASSDEFFGAPLNLLMPGRALNMGDGWETKRRRGPGHDWVIVELGTPGAIRRVEVDTAHFKGNFPDTCSLETLRAPGASGEAIAQMAQGWRTLLPQTKLKPNFRHTFREELVENAIATHVRFNIFPDGGMARLRLFGVRENFNPVSRLNGMPLTQARKLLLDCCGSVAWAAQMIARRPFAGVSELLGASDRVWSELKQSDWLEAFAHHPAIGSKKARARQSSNAKWWSAGEQATARQSSDAAFQELARANQDYRDKFGHVFLICATGKTAGEILLALKMRIQNDAAAEIATAAEEQRKITRLRLEKLLQ